MRRWQGHRKDEKTASGREDKTARVDERTRPMYIGNKANLKTDPNGPNAFLSIAIGSNSRIYVGTPQWTREPARVVRVPHVFVARFWDKITWLLEGPWKKCPPFLQGAREQPGDFNIITQNSDFYL